ncbi:MAG: polynucleotide adenylyltransferase PcnB [Spirochaetaceae bacterium]|nr:polynucleotide adenylyltransferase PcnB [Spirochaetaceae bacterium]
MSRSAKIWTASEHKIKKDDVDPLAAYICERLTNEGFETYIVGGAVRDLLLNKKPKDFDIASAASPAKIKKVFHNSRIIGKRFRLVHVYFDDKIYEIATFRAIEDGVTTGNTFGKIEDDAHRRDFTINGLFYDPRKELVLDFVDGFSDIKARRIRPIIPLNTIFEEDPVRMVRAVKYAAISGFSLPFNLRSRIKKSAWMLEHISPSRLTEEMGKIMKSPFAGKIIKELEVLGLYDTLQPRAAKLLRASAQFRSRYFSRLDKLYTKCAGEAYAEEITGGLLALIADFVDDNVDWKTANEETFKTMFAQARKFVLPINPPRIELARALKNHFSEHGVKVSRWRMPQRS